MIEEVHSDENGTLARIMTAARFLLGLPIPPPNPPQFPNRPNVPGSQQERTTTATTPPHENRETPSPSRPPRVPLDPLSDDSDTLVHDDDSDDDYDDSPLPTPSRLRDRLRRPRNEYTHWRRHVFRLVQMGGHRYYDVRGDAVSSPGNA
jgi:hypothetical protein